MIKNITLHVGYDVVTELPNSYQIEFSLNDRNIPSSLSLWLTADMTLKEFILTLMDFTSKIVSRGFK